MAENLARKFIACLVNTQHKHTEANSGLNDVVKVILYFKIADISLAWYCVYRKGRLSNS